MENRDKSEQLLDLLLDLTDGAATGVVYTYGPAKAYQLAGEVVYELEEAKARIATLEAQAAIGRRAVEMLVDTAERVESLVGWVGRNMNCGCTPLELVKARALIKILRDAEQAAPEPDTVVVDAGALEGLREALRDLDDYWQHTPLMENNVMQHMASAARRLLAGK